MNAGASPWNRTFSRSAVKQQGRYLPHSCSCPAEKRPPAGAVIREDAYLGAGIVDSTHQTPR